MLEIDLELAQKSAVGVTRASAAREQSAQYMAAGKRGRACRALSQCKRALDTAIRRDAAFSKVQADLELVRRALGQRAVSGPLRGLERLSESFRGLLEKFWAGEARAIEREVDRLRAKVGG